MDNMRENILRWFCHVYRRSADTVVRKSNMIEVEDNTKGRSRPQMTLDAVVRKCSYFVNIREHNALDKAQ